MKLFRVPEVSWVSSYCTWLGNAVVDFQMPPICSPVVRPGRPAEATCVVAEQLTNALTRLVPFGFKFSFSSDMQKNVGSS